MTPEDRRILYEVLERVTETHVQMAGFSERLTKHEEADADAHEKFGKSIGAVEKKQTQLHAYYAALLVVAPAVYWFLTHFTTSAAAQ